MPTSKGVRFKQMLSSPARGTYAQRPKASPANADTSYYATDVKITYISDGTTWHAVSPSLGTWFACPPPAAAPAGSVNVANQVYFVAAPIGGEASLTGIGYWVGNTQNGNVRCALYDSTGARVLNKTADVAQAAINTFQKVPFDAPGIVQPGMYHLALVFSSATGTSLKASPMGAAGSVAGPGANATATSITPPTVPNPVPQMTTY